MNRHEATQRTKAIACLRTEIEWLAANPYNRRTALAALATLDDTYEGFSNRETWAAHWYITHDSDVCEDLKDKETGDGVKAWFEHAFRELIEMKEENAIQALADIGSLWRVNWDEVANALLGGE